MCSFVIRFGNSQEFDEIIAVVLPAFHGAITINKRLILNTDLEIPLFGTAFVPEGTLERDVTAQVQIQSCNNISGVNNSIITVCHDCDRSRMIPEIKPGSLNDTHLVLLLRQHVRVDNWGVQTHIAGESTSAGFWYSCTDPSSQQTVRASITVGGKTSAFQSVGSFTNSSVKHRIIPRHTQLDLGAENSILWVAGDNLPLSVRREQSK